MENKEIKKYIEEIDKRYKGEYSEFVKKNSLHLYNIACVEIGKLQKIGQNMNLNIKQNYDAMDLNASFSIAQQFFNMHNIRINLKEMHDKKMIVFYNDNGQRNNQYFGNGSGPTSYQGYTKERGNFVDIVISKNIMDAFAIVHEVTHYMNQPAGIRNVVSDMLTEALSYGMEFAFAQSLLNDNFKAEDAKLFIYNCHREVLLYAFRLAPIYRIIYVYVNSKKIDKDNYNKIINKGNYENDILEFENYIKANRDYIRDTWNFLGRAISLYIYSEYRKDKNFVYKLQKLNDAINYMSFEYCLQTIGIRDIEELFFKISDALDSNIGYILNGFNI